MGALSGRQSSETLADQPAEPVRPARAVGSHRPHRGLGRSGCEVVEPVCFGGDEQGALGEDGLAEDAA